MANVIFKRGQQANLPAAKTDGVFYLTTDTGRLYADYNNNGTVERKLLNQTVNIVASVDALSAISANWSNAADHNQDFYYCAAENILAVWTQDPDNASHYKWVQINPDTDTVILSAALKTASATNNVATLELDIEDSSKTTTATMSVTGANGVKLTKSGDGLVITGRTYDISRAVSADNKVATLSLNDSDSTTATAIKLEGGAGVTFSSTGTNAIIVDSEDTTIQSLAFSSTAPGVLGLTIEDSNTSHSASINQLGVKLNDNSFVLLEQGLTGTAGSIYSKSEIDQKFKDLNGISFKGTIGDVNATISSLPSSGVHQGDMYVVATDGKTSFGNNVSWADPTSLTSSVIGDMIIATGTENNDGEITSNLQWVYIPSGNDSLDTVSYHASVTTSTNTISLQDANDRTITNIGFTAGTNMVLSTSATRIDVDSNSNPNIMTTTISHATITSTTSQSSVDADGTSSFTAITGLTLNNGHVTNIETNTFSPRVYDLDSITITSTTSNAITAAFLVQDDSGGNNGTTRNLNFTSDSINFSNATATNSIQMDLVWGQF